MKRTLAEKYFKEGYNCAQSIVLAFVEEIGVDKQTALRMSSAFGGGMGRLREVCGAVSGMFMVLGAKYGYSTAETGELKRKLYSAVQELSARFKEKNSSIVCRELIGVTGHDNPIPSERTDEYYKKRPCVYLVGDAAEILENYINERNEK